MFRPLPLLVIIAAIFVGILGGNWLGQPPSNQELLANYAKVADYAAAARAVHGVPWWTENSLQGMSLAFLSFGALANAGLMAGAALAGPYLGAKLAGLAFYLLCPLTMYAFIRRLAPGVPWAAFSCGAAYLFAPSILIRLGHVEHVSVVLAMAMLPAAFLGVYLFLRKPGLRSAIYCAVANGLLALAYLKITFLTLPLLLGFALWVVCTRTQFRLPPWPLVAVSAGVYVLLAVLPNLPAAREMRLVNHFDFGPFAGWQQTFSTATALSWVDRDAALTQDMLSMRSAVKTPSSYLGLVTFGCLVAVVFLHRRTMWNTRECGILRVFLALALLAQWLGHGVYSPLTGQMAFLSRGLLAADWAIPLGWILFGFPAIAIFLVTPAWLPGRRWWSMGAVLIYYAVPGFRLLEKVPGYGDIRAPHDFFEIGGVFCFAVAAGFAGWLLVRSIARPGWRGVAAAGLIVAAGADAGTCVPSFFKSPLDRATYDDFLAVQEFLKNDEAPGGVFPYSGRYFYLMTPLLSGRPLATEAFNNHLTQRGLAELQQGSMLSQETFAAFLNICGISFILLDKQDPDTPQEVQEAMRKVLPTVALENGHFAVLRNDGALAPAYFAANYVRLPGATNEAVERALRAATLGIGAVEGTSRDRPGLIEWDERQLPTLSLMKALPKTAVTEESPEKIRVTPPAQAGWLILPMAYHPDWRAEQDGKALRVEPVFHALAGVYVAGPDAPVVLSFRPPWWYTPSVWVSLTAWVLALGALAGWRLGLLRTPAEPEDKSGPARKTDTDRLKRVLVIIPTYNEAASLGATLQKTLSAQARLEVLVVDDNSPDGTAEIVRKDGAYGKRVHLLERAAKQGLGQAYKAGFAWALEHDFDVCVEMDADLSHNPDDIPALLAALEAGADAAIGSRYLKGVRVINWPLERLLLSLGASKFVRFMTGLPLTDATSGFKALRASALKKLDWERFRADGYGFQVELHFFLWQTGARLVEVPIVFTERRIGQTKMTHEIALEAAWRTVQLAFARIRAGFDQSDAP